jgi:hypothetical protein
MTEDGREPQRAMGDIVAAMGIERGRLAELAARFQAGEIAEAEFRRGVEESADKMASLSRELTAAREAMAAAEGAPADSLGFDAAVDRLKTADLPPPLKAAAEIILLAVANLAPRWTEIVATMEARKAAEPTGGTNPAPAAS